MLNDRDVSEKWRLMTFAEDMLEMLEWLEFCGVDQRIEAPCCPVCTDWPSDGHKPDCRLGNLLKRIKGE